MVMIKRQNPIWILGTLVVFSAGLQAPAAKDPPPPVHTAPTPALSPAPPPDSQKVWTTPAPTEAKPKPAPAATSAPVATARRRSAADLEKLVAPIALYPDPLLASVLPASVYPLEVVQAARFVKNPNNLAKLDQQPWDENVKTVARFPEVIDRMSEELSWTVELGQAFVAQQMDVMDSVQTLRAKARATGALRDTPEQTVTVTNTVVQQTAVPEPIYVTNTVVEIQPAQPGVVYVPQYNPAIVYTPAYYYDPWVPLVTFGFGIACGAWFWSDCYWYGGYVAYWPHGYCPPHHPHDGGHPPPPPGGTQPPPPGSGAGPNPGARQASRAAAGEPGSGVAQSASARPWRADANRLQNSFGPARSTAPRTTPTVAAGRAASNPGALAPARAVPSSVTPGARATPATASSARSGLPAGYSRTDVPGAQSTPSVATPGTVQRVTPGPSTVSRSPAGSMVSRSAIPGAQSGWQGTGSGSSRTWATPSSPRSYSASPSISGSMPSRSTPSAPSSFGRVGGMSSGGSYRSPSAPSSFGRSGGGFSAPSGGGGRFSGGGSRGGGR